MKIDRRSWHYRLLSKIYNNGWRNDYGVPKDLCRYMRKLVLTIVGFTVVIAIVVPTLIGGVILVPLMAIYSPDTVHEALSFIPSPVITTIVFIGMFIWLAAVIISLGMLGDYIGSKILNFRFPVNPKGKREKRVGIFAAWWRAHKEKVCPIIEFYEGEQNEH
ncbi:hypothetical protein LCGC14_2096640 [marine sediment metagenome]|uniref:Uncharacterized protein n=1 Tax=marine sediment metagenome TaxID=412755 RepID=A0A0F9EB75_9ZZZZ